MTTRPDDCCRLHSPSVKGYQSNKFMKDRLTLSTKTVRRLSVRSRQQSQERWVEGPSIMMCMDPHRVPSNSCIPTTSVAHTFTL